MPDVEIRPALDTDIPVLDAIDRLTRAPWNSPAPLPEAGIPLFGPGGAPLEGVLAAVREGEVVGFVQTGRRTPLPSSNHVVEITGLGVHPDARRRGIGSALLAAAVARAAEGGARKVALRVLATNPGAIGLYASAGFAEEGRLRSEFLIDGAEVDDVLMAIFPTTSRQSS